MYFEWTIAPSNTVSVHVSESSDEEEFEEEETQRIGNDFFQKWDALVAAPFHDAVHDAL